MSTHAQTPAQVLAAAIDRAHKSPDFDMYAGEVMYISGIQYAAFTEDGQHKTRTIEGRTFEATAANGRRFFWLALVC